jgi:hypothetical protein
VKNKLFISAALLAVILSFTACKGPAGPSGFVIASGAGGESGGMGVRVKDSADKLLGYVLRGDAISATILTANNQVISVSMTTGEPGGRSIYFLTTSAPVNNITPPYTFSSTAPANPSYYYNPNSGGLYFKYAGAPVISHTDQPGEYYYNLLTGTSATIGTGGSAFDYYALNWLTESEYNNECYGFTASVTPPLKYTVLP